MPLGNTEGVFTIINNNAIRSLGSATPIESIPSIPEDFPKPQMYAPEAIKRMREAGYTNPYIKDVEEAEEIIFGSGVRGKFLVLGSGPNSEIWQQRGFTTLDIDPTVNPDIVANANDVTEQHPELKANYRCVFAEAIRFDPTSKTGVSRGALLAQMNNLLEKNGLAVIQTANFERRSPNIKVPKRDNFALLMARHGYRVTKVVLPYTPGMAQEVWYIGRKIAEGYDKKRAKPEIDTLPLL